MAENSTVAKPEATGVATPKTHPSGIVLKDDHTQVAAYFVICSVILIAAAIVIPFTVHDGRWLSVMALFGSIIIIALMSAAAVPHLQRSSHPVRH